jgi:hypothetical protein
MSDQHMKRTAKNIIVIKTKGMKLNYVNNIKKIIADAEEDKIAEDQDSLSVEDVIDLTLKENNINVGVSDCTSPVKAVNNEFNRRILFINKDGTFVYNLNDCTTIKTDFFSGIEFHVATLLPNNNVFVHGGCKLGTILDSYSIANGSDKHLRVSDGPSKVLPNLMQHCAVALPDGNVYIFGGHGTTSESEDWNEANNVIVLDSYTGEVRILNAKPSGCLYGSTATYLPKYNKIVIIGNQKRSHGIEVFDVATSAFEADPIQNNRLWVEGHTATLLNDGRIFIVGGLVYGSLGKTFLYDYGTNTLEEGSVSGLSYKHHTATLLPHGRVLLCGGTSANNDPHRSESEIYDPKTDTFVSGFTFDFDVHCGTATLF